ncbi:hypothetical protein [uncultured Bosea sp.]|uniref:hypothetical protein n=1 Tax=uncultured Bosea sp. TaxID=211457 RepID=UPI0025E60189|nr:hypothetical protein [uncultured Bosea sp.]
MKILPILSIFFLSHSHLVYSQTIQEFPLASCKSWNGTVVSISGAGTSRASMVGTVTRDNLKEYCERTHDNGDGKDKSALIAKCMTEMVSGSAGASVSATANCSTGRLRFTDERGKSREAQFPLPSDSDQSCASGMPPLIAQFAILCPRSVAPSSGSKQARLPFADGTYVTDPSLCRLNAQQINDRLGDATSLQVRQINGARLTDGYEMSCKVVSVSMQGDNVRFQAGCASEGEPTRIRGSWIKIDDRTFRIGQKTFQACGRSIWPAN